MDTSLRLFGVEWQEWANQLLVRRYGPGEYQRIPDTDSGDAGLEGFSFSGHAYQAYGPAEPLATQDRYEKHRAKMTRDINKFKSNRDVLAKLLGKVRIKRWILLVPVFDSKNLIVHAAKKTAEVVTANLPYVDNEDFQVCINDEKEFAKEKRELLTANLQKIGIEPDQIQNEFFESWVEANDQLVETIDTKVAKLPTLTDDTKRRCFRNEMIKRLLEGQNALDELRQYPEIFEKVRRCKGLQERYLRSQSLLAEVSNNQLLKDSQQALRKQCKTDAPALTEVTLDAIAWEAIADWLARCPLDFPTND